MDIIPDTSANAQLAGSVTAGSRSTNTIAGSVQAAAVSTYMAINGDGFFAVQKPGNFSDNNPVFDGVNRYTRRGDFSLDKNGYLVNGAGYYLEGVPIDPTTGNPSGSVPQVLRFQNDFLPSQATTKIDYRANLASYPLTNKHDTSVPGSELLRPADFGTTRRSWDPAAPFRRYSQGWNLGSTTTAGTPITAHDAHGTRGHRQLDLLDFADTGYHRLDTTTASLTTTHRLQPPHRVGGATTWHRRIPSRNCGKSNLAGDRQASPARSHRFAWPPTYVTPAPRTTFNGLTAASPAFHVAWPHHRSGGTHRRRHGWHRHRGRQRQSDIPRRVGHGGACTAYDGSGAW